MTELRYWTKEMQAEQGALSAPQQREALAALALSQAQLLRQLTAFACGMLRRHDADFDPLVLKGLCLALGPCHKPADAASLAQHITAMDEILAMHGFSITLAPEQILPPEDLLGRAMQRQILSDLCAIAQKAYSAYLLDRRSYHVNYFLYQALAALTTESKHTQLEALLLRARSIHAFCDELLHKAFSSFSLPRKDSLP